jgi:hypothetical protein
MSSPTVAQQIYQECLQDYVGLWSVVRRFRAFASVEQSDISKTVLHLLMQLISERKIVAGDFAHGKFRQWEMSPQEIIARIEREWTSLGHDPNIGEIVWFTAGKGPMS